MYDSQTAALISSAPALEGLDLSELPQKLTNAYAAIVANRVRLRQLIGKDSNLDELSEVLAEIKRLAFTNEALVSAIPNRADRSAAAFVAASAHHLWQLSDKLWSTKAHPSGLAINGIPPEVSATILFLIAEATADASETAKLINVESSDAVEAGVLSAISALAQGDLQGLTQIPIPESQFPTDVPTRHEAHRRLLSMILLGLRYLGEDLLSVDSDARGVRAIQLFDRVKQLSIEKTEPAELPEVISTFPGAYHLASLLSCAATDLGASVLTKLPPPHGVDGGNWRDLMKEFARRRPYLWRNHRQAVAEGYLERGVSAVISFPTGAGKSALAELKIAAALLRGEKVIFLAPTLALVDQTARALRAAFKRAEVQREKWEALTFDDLLLDSLPEISVMTPERCLAMLAFDRSVFEGVGLLVFDECHLVHPTDPNRSRRALDAMLCVLNFVAAAPNADLLLLSAMMKNAEEIAKWLQEVTGRTCIPLNLTWKPTRQVRGCVVYESDVVRSLAKQLRTERAKTKAKTPPVKIRKAMRARPHSFFCLRQTWQSNARKDYALLPLLEEEVLLGISSGSSGDWYLTPNGNQVAASIARATSALGFKTLLFVQNRTHCDSTATSLSEALGPKAIVLSPDEKRLVEISSEEMGDVAHLYAKFSSKGELESACLPHHSLLLPWERQLHESLFRRLDGINALVATSTLAQGMNLPSEIVIIAGDSRFEASANRLERLQAHELLNAAGRAGRAGEDSHGFVVVVPSKVVDFESSTNTIHKHWMDLKAIFAQGDQCLEIEDPLTGLLDEIHLAGDKQSDLADYLITRFPRGPIGDPNPDEHARTFLLRSFAAYRAKARGEEIWIEERVRSALKFRNARLEETAGAPWADQLSASVGLPSALILDLSLALEGVEIIDSRDVDYWWNWAMSWLRSHPGRVTSVVRRESLEGFMGGHFRALATAVERGNAALPAIESLLHIWLKGGTLADMEVAFGTPKSLIGKCRNARQFVLRIVPDLAYFFGLPFQILSAKRGPAADELMPGLAISTLGTCVREGFDRAEKLALRQIRRETRSRVGIHEEFKKIEPFLEPSSGIEDLAMATQRVKSAIEMAR